MTDRVSIAVFRRADLVEQQGRRNEARAPYRHLVELAPRRAPAPGRLQTLDAIAAAAA